MSTARRTLSTRAVLLVVLAVLACLTSLVPTGRATARDTRGTAVGEVLGARGVPIKISWFDSNWTFLGQRRLHGSIYTITLPAGTYHLQFTDLRPAYDVTKFAPSDVQVTLRGGSRVQRNVRMQRGAAITGTVRVGATGSRGSPGGGARVVAARSDGASFDVAANSRGQFALGGLTSGNYSIFTFDRSKQWVTRSLYVRGVKQGTARNVAIRLSKRAGTLLVELRNSGGGRMGGRFFVTAVSKATGQFWTARAQNGSATFEGLYPGGYRMVAPGVGDWLARTGSIVGAEVRSGHPDLASTFTWTTRGGSFDGTIVADGTHPQAGAVVRLYDRAGDLIADTLTDSSGRFHLGGQLLTQSDLTLVAYNQYSTDYDRYQRAGLSIHTNEQVQLGTIELMRHSTASPSTSTAR